jgi:hypothetical protein
MKIIFSKTRKRQLVRRKTLLPAKNVVQQEIFFPQEIHLIS